MIKYGKIVNGQLVEVDMTVADAKPVIYAEITGFDQLKYYVIQDPPIDTGNNIYMGVKILELPPEKIIPELYNVL